MAMSDISTNVNIGPLSLTMPTLEIMSTGEHCIAFSRKKKKNH